MKTSDQRNEGVPARRIGAGIAARIAPMFARYDFLCGFSVQRSSTVSADRINVELDAGLCLADVCVSTWPGLRPTAELLEEIAGTLRNLLDEHPKTAELLAGRSFARTLH